MIKYVQCVRRKPDISIPEFRKYWKLYAEKAQELMAKVGGTRMSFSNAQPGKNPADRNAAGPLRKA